MPSSTVAISLHATIPILMSVGYRRYVFGWRHVIGALESAPMVTGAAVLLVLVLAMPVAAQISAGPISNRAIAGNALAEPVGPSAEEPPLPPQGEAGGTTGLPDIQANPMAATSGGLGLFTLETGELLESGWSFSIYGNRFTRMPGSVVVSNYGINFGWGYRKWINFEAAFQPEVATQIGNPGELSLRTPPDMLAFPQVGSTIYRALGPGQRPGYVEDFPFASRNDSGPGNVTLGVKFALLSQRDGAAVNLSARNDVIIPTRYTLTQLLGNGTQTGEIADLISVASSHQFGSLITLVGDFGYLLTRDPRAGGARDLTQADQVRLGTGYILFPEKRIQFMNEYNGLVFAGAATPNSTFGARDPVDGIWGLRIYVLPQAAVDIGYRYMLNLGNAADRSGFVIKVGITSWPF